MRSYVGLIARRGGRDRACEESPEGTAWRSKLPRENAVRVTESERTTGACSGVTPCRAQSQEWHRNEIGPAGGLGSKASRECETLRVQDSVPWEALGIKAPNHWENAEGKETSGGDLPPRSAAGLNSNGSPMRNVGAMRGCWSNSVGEEKPERGSPWSDTVQGYWQRWNTSESS